MSMTACVSDSSRTRKPQATYLLVLELDQVPVILDDLVTFVLTLLEELGQSEPLACHLVSVVGVNELVIVDAVGCVTLDASDSGLTAIEREDIIHKSLALGAEWERLGRVGGEILCG